MRRLTYRRARLIPLLFMLILGLLATPAGVSASQMKLTVSADTVPLAATIYLPTATLLPLFQSRVNQQVPNDTNNIIGNMVGSMPAANQGWAGQIARTLIQPSATVNQLTPQQNGLDTDISLSLYPGDPKPTDVKSLITFSVKDSSTIQVSGQPEANSPALINGPLTTIQVPVGQLNSVNTTPGCADSALAVNLQVPVSLNQPQSTPSAQSQSLIEPASHTPATTLQSVVGAHSRTQLLGLTETRRAQDTLSTYVEIPAASLSSLVSHISSLPISQTLTAQNIRLGVQGSNLVLTSDISLWSTGVALATATTYLTPSAQNGNLVLQVGNTTLTVLVFNFPDDTYNQQIQQLLDNELGSALGSSLHVTDAAIGPNSHITCAKSDSLILTGTTSVN